jgi:tetrapyrrole methylase family protein/MazG family protein
MSRKADKPQRGSDPAPRGIDRLLDVVRRLRGEDGCPWDREQTLVSLKRYLIEESYELLDAVDSGDPGRHREELGDVLLQIAMQAQIRREEGAFGFDDVAEAVATKLIRRHPHVFGDVTVAGSAEVLRNWELIKAEERRPTGGSALAGVPRHLPALHRAERVQACAARVGFDWEHVGDVKGKIEEELRELAAAMDAADAAQIEEELGDLLFSIVNLCRFLGVHPEDALDGTTAKFTARFQAIERMLVREGRGLKDCTPAELDARWNAVKKREKPDRAGGKATSRRGRNA